MHEKIPVDSFYIMGKIQKVTVENGARNTTLVWTASKTTARRSEIGAEKRGSLQERARALAHLHWPRSHVYRAERDGSPRAPPPRGAVARACVGSVGPWMPSTPCTMRNKCNHQQCSSLKALQYYGLRDYLRQMPVRILHTAGVRPRGRPRWRGRPVSYVRLRKRTPQSAQLSTPYLPERGWTAEGAKSASEVHPDATTRS